MGDNTPARDGENASFARISSSEFKVLEWLLESDKRSTIVVYPLYKRVTKATCELLTALSRERRVKAFFFIASRIWQCKTHCIGHNICNINF
jgi:hypothetical protein